MVVVRFVAKIIGGVVAWSIEFTEEDAGKLRCIRRTQLDMRLQLTVAILKPDLLVRPVAAEVRTMRDGRERRECDLLHSGGS